MIVCMRDIHFISHYFQLQTMLRQISLYMHAYVVVLLFLYGQNAFQNGKFPITMDEYPSLAPCSPFLSHLLVAFENLSPSFYFDLYFSDDLWTCASFNILLII